MQKNLQNLLKNKKLIKNGYNHDVFSSEVEGCKYVVHQGRSERDSGSDLNNTNSVLRFLESREITFVPKIVHFDTSKDLLIQSYVGMEDVVFVELSLDELDVFMHHLALIHSFTEAEVRQFCINRNVSMLRVHTPEESLRIFGEERFEAVKKTCPDKDVLSWIAPHLAENITLVKTLTQQKKPVLQMGDIGGNLRTGAVSCILLIGSFRVLDMTMS